MIDERVLADGRVEAGPGPDACAPRSPRRKAKVTTLCDSVQYGLRYPAHERIVARRPRTGFEQVSESHVASALIKFVSRGDTTVVDAYLSPILARYVGQVLRDLDVERTGARDVHDVVGRPHFGGSVRREGRDPVRPRRRSGRDGAHGG